MVENYDNVSEEEEDIVKPQVAYEKAKVNKKDDKSKAKKKNRALKRKRLKTTLKESRRNRGCGELN